MDKAADQASRIIAEAKRQAFAWTEPERARLLREIARQAAAAAAELEAAESGGGG